MLFLSSFCSSRWPARCLAGCPIFMLHFCVCVCCVCVCVRRPVVWGPAPDGGVLRVCEWVGPDGHVCAYEGTPAQVGAHRYKTHGACNPAKALVLTNECPGCRGLYKNQRAAKEHAARSLVLGRCQRSREGRAFYENIEREQLDEATCPMCQEVLTGWEKIQETSRRTCA